MSAKFQQGLKLREKFRLQQTDERRHQETDGYMGRASSIPLWTLIQNRHTLWGDGSLDALQTPGKN